MDNYTQLPGNIKSWNELANKFICHFVFNIDNKVTMIDLLLLNRKKGNPSKHIYKDG